MTSNQNAPKKTDYTSQYEKKYDHHHANDRNTKEIKNYEDDYQPKKKDQEHPKKVELSR